MVLWAHRCDASSMHLQPRLRNPSLRCGFRLVTLGEQRGFGELKLFFRYSPRFEQLSKLFKLLHQSGNALAHRIGTEDANEQHS